MNHSTVTTDSRILSKIVTERRTFPLALPRSLPGRLGLGAAIGYAALAGLVGLAYRSFLYPAPTAGLEPQVKGTTVWRLPGERGEVFALFAAPKADNPVIVYFHGNGEELVDLSPVARTLEASGFGVLFVEYPGYALAKGQKTTEHAIYDAAERALRELDERGYGADRVVLVGQSLGSGVAAEMAVRAKGGRLVLISPYTSIPDMVGRFVPFLPVGLLVRDRFDTFEKASSIRVPTLVVHGGADRLIPPAMGSRVAEAIVGARLEIVEGVGHNELWSGDARSGSVSVRGSRLFELLVEFAAPHSEKGAGARAPAN